MRPAILICILLCVGAYAQQKQDRAARVLLTKCQIDRVNVPCNDFTISFQSGARTIPARRDATGSSFTIPAELEEQPTANVVISSSRGQFRSGPIPTNRLRGSWQIGVDHAPFDRGLQGIAATRAADCVGWIVFTQPNAEEPAVYSACDR
jgi:hypothetical protein